MCATVFNKWTFKKGSDTIGVIRDEAGVILTFANGVTRVLSERSATIAEMIIANGKVATIKIQEMDITAANFAFAFPEFSVDGGVLTYDATDVNKDISTAAYQDKYSLHPADMDTDESYDIVLRSAVLVPADFDIVGDSKGMLKLSIMVEQTYDTTMLAIGESAVTTAPVVSSTSPADDATDVTATVNITIVFSLAMNEAFMTSDYIPVYEDGGGVGDDSLVAAAYSYSTSTKTLTITPTEDMTAGTDFNCTVSKLCRNAVGVEIAAPYQFGWAVAA